jgi:hypothetical protein
MNKVGKCEEFGRLYPRKAARFVYVTNDNVYKGSYDRIAAFSLRFVKVE